ncbi:GNAT family acetyltransferase [soil metagenome]
MQAIVQYADPIHRQAVIDLWNQVFGYQAAHNNPVTTIDLKLAVDDGLFFVCEQGGAVVGTTMAGYDGHRGWLYSVAVHPSQRRSGIGAALVEAAEAALAALGCLKINLQIIAENGKVAAFYEALGYSQEPRISMGKRIVVGSAA